MLIVSAVLSRYCNLGWFRLANLGIWSLSTDPLETLVVSTSYFNGEIPNLIMSFVLFKARSWRGERIGSEYIKRFSDVYGVFTYSNHIAKGFIFSSWSLSLVVLLGWAGVWRPATRLPRKLHRDSFVYTYDLEHCPKKHPFYCFALSLRLFTSSFIKFCLIKENWSELSATVAVVWKWAQSARAFSCPCLSELRTRSCSGSSCYIQFHTLTHNRLFCEITLCYFIHSVAS